MKRAAERIVSPQESTHWYRLGSQSTFLAANLNVFQAGTDGETMEHSGFLSVSEKKINLIM